MSRHTNTRTWTSLCGSVASAADDTRTGVFKLRRVQFCGWRLILYLYSSTHSEVVFLFLDFFVHPCKTNRGRVANGGAFETTLSRHQKKPEAN